MNLHPIPSELRKMIKVEWLAAGVLLILSSVGLVTSQICRRRICAFVKLHSKKMLAVFPSPAGMSLTKLSLAGNYLDIPVLGEFGGGGL
jgi:hypothetical protein